MPVPTDRLAADLTGLLHRALSRARTGAWTGADETLARASDLLPELIRRLPPHDPALRTCFDLLGRLHERTAAAHHNVREELAQLRIARARLRPTRQAYTRPTEPARTAQFAGTA